MKGERILLFVLASVMFTNIMDFMIMMPLGPQLMRIFKINPQQFSFLVSSYTFTAGITGFFSAFAIDRFDRRKSLLFVYIGFTIGTIACAFAPTYYTLLITRSVTGAFGGVLGALVLAMVSDAIPLERRAKGVGIVMASFSVASVFGVPFGLWMAQKFSWHAPFLFLGIFAALLSILIFMLVPAMRSHVAKEHKNPIDVLRIIFGNRNPRLGLMFSSLLILGQFTIIPFIAPYMVGNVGFTEGELMYIYLVGGACTIFFSPWVGKMADRYGRLKIFTIFGSLVIFPILAITNMPPAPLWAALVVAGLFFIFANGRVVTSTTMETAIIAPQNRGSYMSIRSSVQQLSSGLASYMAGLVVTERPSDFAGQAKALVHYEYVGFIAVFFSLVSLWIARQLKVEQGS